MNKHTTLKTTDVSEFTTFNNIKLHDHIEKFYHNLTAIHNHKVNYLDTPYN